MLAALRLGNCGSVVKMIAVGKFLSKPKYKHMLRLNPPTDGKPLEVLCLGSHADDIEIGCGGTMLQLLASRRDTHVTWVVFSANSERAKEARLSADRFLERAKQKEIIVKDFRDGFFPFEGAKIKESF